MTKSLEFKDLYISPEEYIELIYDAAETSGYFNNGMSERQHPEDIAFAFSHIINGVGHAILSYSQLIWNREE